MRSATVCKRASLIGQVPNQSSTYAFNPFYFSVVNLKNERGKFKAQKDVGIAKTTPTSF
jgi:hypothetical protein